MKKKRFLAILMAAVTFLTTCIPVCAENQIFEPNGSDTVANVEASGERPSLYKVCIPAMISLSKNSITQKDYAAGYRVGAAGNIASNEFVNLVPETKDFILKDRSGSRSVQPDVYANKVSWSGNELDTDPEMQWKWSGSMIEAKLRRAGKYNGDLIYNFWLSEEDAENTNINYHSTTGVDDDGKLIVNDKLTDGSLTIDCSLSTSLLTKIRVYMDENTYKDYTNIYHNMKIPTRSGQDIIVWHDNRIDNWGFFPGGRTYSNSHTISIGYGSAVTFKAEAGDGKLKFANRIAWIPDYSLPKSENPNNEKQINCITSSNYTDIRLDDSTGWSNLINNSSNIKIYEGIAKERQGDVTLNADFPTGQNYFVARVKNNDGQDFWYQINKNSIPVFSGQPLEIYYSGNSEIEWKILANDNSTLKNLGSYRGIQFICPNLENIDIYIKPVYQKKSICGCNIKLWDNEMADSIIGIK